MCFSYLDKCEHSDDPDLLCPFAKNISENETFCKLIYPVYADIETDVSILPKCFNKMKLRDKYSWGRKMQKRKSLEP